MIGLSLDELLVTQPALRKPEQVAEMATFVSNGGHFDQRTLKMHAETCNSHVSPLIQVNLFEDGVYALMDGHHRCVSIWAAGRRYLCRDEYRQCNLTYADFAEVVFDKGWVTPYDPRTHIRLPDLITFKEVVERLRTEHCDDKALQYILGNRQHYCRERTITGIGELYDVWQRQCKEIKLQPT